MAVDMFLKIDGIPGESSDRVHKGEIEVDSFSFGMTNAGAHGAGGGGGAGKVSFQDLHFTSRVNKASPLLAKSCATGEHIKTATLSVRRSGEQQVDFLKYELADVLVSDFADGFDPKGDADLPEDAFSLAFAKIAFSYATQNADGQPGDWVTFGWDLKQNKGA
jgi:type VI secretion system secreted protein Hcp